MYRPRVVLVDDVDIFRETVAAYLSRNGLDVSQAGDGAGLRELCRRTDFDIAILDLGLPDEDGLDLVRHLRGTQQCGIIVLTGNDDPVDAVVGLELGADDYLLKPHSNRELLARVRTVLRRIAPRPESGPRRAGVDDWTLDDSRCGMSAPDGRWLSLTRGEFLLLSTLSGAPGVPVGREALSRGVLQREWTYDDRSLDVLVTRLRRKLAPHGLDGELLSVRGVGYMIEAPRPPRAPARHGDGACGEEPGPTGPRP